MTDDELATCSHGRIDRANCDECAVYRGKADDEFYEGEQ